MLSLFSSAFCELPRISGVFAARRDKQRALTSISQPVQISDCFIVDEDSDARGPLRPSAAPIHREPLLCHIPPRKRMRRRLYSCPISTVVTVPSIYVQLLFKKEVSRDLSDIHGATCWLRPSNLICSISSSPCDQCRGNVTAISTATPPPRTPAHLDAPLIRRST